MAIAKSTRLHRLALQRHRDSHMWENLIVKAEEGETAPPPGNVNEQLKRLIAQASELQAIAKRNGGTRAAVASIKAIQSIVDSQIRMAEAARDNPYTRGGDRQVTVKSPDNGRSDTLPVSLMPKAIAFPEAVAIEDNELMIRIPIELLAQAAISSRAAFRWTCGEPELVASRPSRSALFA